LKGVIKVVDRSDKYASVSLVKGIHRFRNFAMDVRIRYHFPEPTKLNYMTVESESTGCEIAKSLSKMKPGITADIEIDTGSEVLYK
jgi:hypothetical protein